MGREDGSSLFTANYKLIPASGGPQFCKIISKTALKNSMNIAFQEQTDNFRFGNNYFHKVPAN